MNIDYLEKQRHGDMEMETWKHGDIETWKHREMKIWRWRHGSTET
jgi:hypothetical protein